MKRNLVIATVAAAALIGGGTVAASAAGAGDTTAAGGEVRSQARTATVTAEDAITAALKHTPGTAVGADRDDDGAKAWEVEVVKGDGAESTVRVSPSTGEILGVQRDDDGADDGREDLAALKGTSVDAREAARAGAAKGAVVEVGLDDDAHPTVWSVETTKGEWAVDARTGKVTQDHDDADDRHGDDD